MVVNVVSGTRVRGRHAARPEHPARRPGVAPRRPSTTPEPVDRSAPANPAPPHGFDPDACPPPVRPVALALLAAALAGCVGPFAPASAGPDAEGPIPPPRAIASHPDTLLARLTPDALDYAYDPTRGTPAARTAGIDWPTPGAALTLSVDDLDPAGATVGRYRQRTDRLRTGVGATILEAAGTLADTSEGTVAVPASPLRAALPDEPPYLDPRVRDRYDRRRIPTRWPHAAAAEAVLRPDAGGVQAVRRVAVVVDTLTGRVLAATVVRRTASLLYDETLRVDVAMRRAANGRSMPRVARVESRVDTPVSPPRHLVQTWATGPSRDL